MTAVPLLCCLAACSDPTSPVPLALVVSSAVAPNPANTISAVVTVDALLADSIAVRFGPSGSGLDSITPAFPAGDNVTRVPVLGLLPDVGYTLQAMAWGADGVVATGDALTFRTGGLPADLPRYTAGGPSPEPGYVVFAAGLYGIVIDNVGRIVWYRRFDMGPGLNFQAQPNGRYVARPPPVHAQVPEPWVEVDVLGNTTRLLYCAGGLQTRFHDMVALPDGSFWTLCDETRTLDLTAFGGVAAASVTGTVLQHIGADGALVFEWNSFDAFEITDLDVAERSGPIVNWTHGNAMDFDTDGNIYLSFRSLNEITKIDGRTGAVLWRLGGLRNQFTFEAGAQPFDHQHGLRSIDRRTFVILDNLGSGAGSRAERYIIDEATHSARMIASYESLPGVIARLGGSVQALSGGNILVAFGNGGRVEEYDADGNVVWHIDDPGYVFRAQRIPSLYHAAAGSPR